ncbi:hypothetical protein PYW08_000588 [Mythimna loreyi]|uniref:Uncharacterized protein n=1 Tax=Mythimna loreyi TaxID=667449 RepID=A0ACC2RCV6_9NEOP|nr:hypothetical protein PYW08_000588 [Mythimna loreyi]
MYVYTLLSICSLTAAANFEGLWNIVKSVVDLSHKVYVPVDARLNITQLARKYGYILQEHTVITEDEYVLHIHRIPNFQKRNGPIVLLMHGLLESSDSWTLMGPDKALAYVLSDQGFDVWMGNSRGNKHAQTHMTLNTSMSEYWDFTWEEIALYDLPAMIDYILEETESNGIYYVGHSQGTTVGYVLCSMKPEYNDKIKIMFSLAPVAWMGHVKSPIVRTFAPAQNLLHILLKYFNTYKVVEADILNKVLAFVCTIMSEKCDSILYALSGHETKLDDTFLSIILGHWPTGSSILQFLHYGQLVDSHRFCRFDYGEEDNIMKYGERIPPDYNLRYVTVPVVLFYSAHDWLADTQDVEILMNNLPNVNETIFIADFTHLDYVYASDALDVVYGRIINKINDYENYYYYLFRS